MPTLRSRGLCGCVCLHDSLVYNCISVRPMSDNDKHIICTAVGSFIIGIAVMIALWLAGVKGTDAYPAVLLSGFLGGLAAGVGKEYGDECAEGNQWSWQDIAADAIGSLVGSGFAMIITILL